MNPQRIAVPIVPVIQHEGHLAHDRTARGLRNVPLAEPADRGVVAAASPRVAGGRARGIQPPMSTTVGNSPYAESSGSFKRRGPRFTDRIVASPSSEQEWPAEPGRYRLVASLACPWAHRSIIVRRLMGLEDAISLAIVDPLQDDRSWRFSLDEDGRDPVLGYRYL